MPPLRATKFYQSSEIIISHDNLTPPRRRKPLIAVVMIAYGLFLMVQSAWVATNNRHSAALFHASGSCEFLTEDSVNADRPACRIERAEVLQRDWHSTKGDGVAYDLVVRSAHGVRDEMHLYGGPMVLFWRRATPGEIIRVQRFVAPGYRRTDAITALGDKRGWIRTPEHPDAKQYGESGLILFGGSLSGIGMMLYASWFLRWRRAPR